MRSPNVSAIPRVVLLFLGLLGAAVALSAGAMAVVSLAVAARPVWILFGFEVVVMLAGVIAVLFARGKFHEAQGMTLLCIAGTVFAGSVLGWLSVNGALQVKNTDVPVSLKMWLLARLGCAGVFALAAAGVVLTRRRESRPYLVRAVLTGTPLVLIGAGIMLTRHQLAAMAAGVHPVVSIFVVCILGLVGIALASISGHCLIRAFEVGAEDGSREVARAGAQGQTA
jgi:hypothetical protein